MTQCCHGFARHLLSTNRTAADRWLSTLGVPRLRAIFLDVFGHHTASNNGAWLRRKLAEPADGGRGRAAQIRARDATAAIWTTGRAKGGSKVQSLSYHRRAAGIQCLNDPL